MARNHHSMADQAKESQTPSPVTSAGEPAKKPWMGRPRLPVNEERLFELASKGLSTPEIAAELQCSPDTLERNFRELLNEGKEHFKATLRAKQCELALAGNVTMLIWLGKNALGQTDKTEVFDRDTPFDHDVDREAIIERIVGSKKSPPAVQ